MCPPCGLPVTGKKRYCHLHHRAFENIQRQACKPPLGVKPKKKTAKDKKKVNNKGKSKKDSSASSGSS
eukprot:13436901-Heterocapsa_arctica.AAC.1